MSSNVSTKFTAVDRFTSVVKQMTTGVFSFSKKAVGAFKRVDSAVSNQLKGLGKVNNLLLGLGVGMTLNTAFAAITDFETKLVGVGKTANIEGIALKDLGSQFLDLSDKIKVVPTDKILELGMSAGQLGVKGSENILKFSETMAKLESATDIVGEEGAASIARILNITNEGIGVIDKFGASLVDLGNNSAATESEILSVSKEVAKSISTYGVSSKFILGLSASMKSLAVAPEAAGSAIGKTFRSMSLATVKGGEALNRFAKIAGISSADFKKEFAVNSEEVFVKFIKGLSNIHKSGGNLQKTMLDLGLSGEIVAKGILPMATNVELVNKQLIRSNKAWDANVALNKEFDASSKTVAKSLIAVKNAFENTINRTAQSGDKMSILSNLLIKVADNMDYVVVIGGIFLGLFGALKVAIISVEIATASYTAAQWLLNSALLSNPIGAIIIAIVALIGYISTVITYYDDWGAALATFSGVVGVIINLVQSFRRNWDDLVSTFETDGLIAGILKVKDIIIDSLLMPMEQVFNIMSSLPLLGDIGKSGGNLIKTFRNDLNVVNSPQQNTTEATFKNENKNSLDVTIRDKGDNVSSVSNNGADIPVNITNTAGAF